MTETPSGGADERRSVLVTDDTLADRIVAAVREVPGVASMHPGRYGEVATHLPHRRVIGIQLRDDSTAVHITLAWGADLLATGDAVRQTVSRLIGRPVHIVIEDVLGPPGAAGADPG